MSVAATTSSEWKQILLVEDEDAHAELICRAFESLDEHYRLTVARSLAEAREAVQKDRQHLVIADFRLPDGHGTDLISMESGVAAPPVVLMTSQGSEKVAVDALKRGAIDYVVKSPEVFANMPHVAERALREWHHIEQRDDALLRLREEGTRLRLITDAIPASIAYVDSDGRFQFVNAGYERWYGKPKEWFIGRTLRSVVGGKAYDAVKHSYASVFEGSAQSFEGWSGASRAEPRYMRTECVPHRGDNGRVVGFYVLITDLSNMKREEEERTRLHEQLAERTRLAAIGTTAAMFAHEVANPLNNMYLHAQVLERQLHKGGGDTFLPEVLELKNEIKRLNDLLREFRSMARHQTFELESVDLAALLDEVLNQYVDHDAIEVVRAFDRKMPAAFISAAKMKQVFLNLFMNAIEAMPDGGTLTVRVEPTEESITIDVTDTGIGVPADVDVFEPFKTTKPGGTGLGLAIVKQIVAGHGGTITYSSLKGEGTTFQVVLPRQGESRRRAAF